MKKHKWIDHPTDKRSRHNRVCKDCGCEKIVSPWNVRDITYKVGGVNRYSELPGCKKECV